MSVYIKDDEELQQHLLKSAMDGAAIVAVSGGTLAGPDLIALSREYLAVRTAITRLRRRHEPPVLWALTEVRPPFRWCTGSARYNERVCRGIEPATDGHWWACNNAVLDTG